jgi:hypothetical protein
MKIGEKFLDFRSGITYHVEYVDDTQAILKSQDGSEMVMSTPEVSSNIHTSSRTERQ